MAGGSTPIEGSYSKEVAKALRFIMSQAKTKFGFITEHPNSQSRMHGHGFASLFLAEAYGMTPYDRQSLKQKIQNAVQCIEVSQTEHGGWGYYPQPKKGDEASVTITQIQALRAIRNAGFQVNSETIQQAIDYVKKCHRGNGSFQYSIHRNSFRTSFALTAAAISTLNYSGYYYKKRSSEEQKKIAHIIKKGLNYLKKHRAEYGDRWFYYGHFYAAQAFYFSERDRWEEWYRAIADELLNHQQDTGAWENRLGTEYATSISLLILQIPYNYLPIFQR